LINGVTITGWKHVLSLLKRRGIFLLPIVVAHAAILYLAHLPPDALPASSPEATMQVVFLSDPAADTSTMVRPIAAPDLLPIAPRPVPQPNAPVIDAGADPDVSAAGTRAPFAIDPDKENCSYANAAGLAPGDGATTVLLVEVLDTDKIGSVSVDVSGGTEAIDKAAMRFVRELTWVGGQSEGKPVPMKVRFAVHLQC
jgi:hypothetical protein